MKKFLLGFQVKFWKIPYGHFYMSEVKNQSSALTLKTSSLEGGSSH